MRPLTFGGPIDLSTCDIVATRCCCRQRLCVNAIIWWMRACQSQGGNFAAGL